MTTRATTPENPEDYHHLAYRDVDHLFQAGEIIKQGESQDVNLCQYKGKKLIIKCYKAKGILSAFRILIRSSRPHKSLRYAYRLRKHDVPCPAHFLVVARYSLNAARAYLLIEHVAGSPLFELLHSEKPQRLSEKTAQAAIETIQQLHSLGLSHGDLHTKNMIVNNESTVQLIDLDNVRKNRRRQHKDIIRFKNSVEDGNQNSEILLEKINTQL